MTGSCTPDMRASAAADAVVRISSATGTKSPTFSSFLKISPKLLLWRLPPPAGLMPSAAMRSFISTPSQMKSSSSPSISSAILRTSAKSVGKPSSANPDEAPEGRSFSNVVSPSAVTLTMFEWLPSIRHMALCSGVNTEART